MPCVPRQDRALIVGPRASSDGADPGPSMIRIPRTGAVTKVDYANAVTPEAMVIDASDNVWMVGQLYRPITFGGPTADPVDEAITWRSSTRPARRC
jgi:hypothetical protein